VVSFARTTGAAFLVAMAALARSGLASGGDAASGTHPRPTVVLSPLARRELAADRERAPVDDTTANTATGQSLFVTVVPGPLELLGAPRTVSLIRDPGTDRFRGTVRGLRVVDARGTDAGWRLSTAVTELDLRRDDPGNRRQPVARAASVHVRKVVAMARATDGITARSTAPLRGDQATWLVTAAPGSGSGVFDVVFEVELRAPAARADQLRGRVTFALS
jgi:hypothetical protein